MANLASHLLLFVLSTFVAVALEELFFREVLQRSLGDRIHTAVGIGVVSLCLASLRAVEASVRTPGRGSGQRATPAPTLKADGPKATPGF